MRTLDLVRLLDQINRGLISRQDVRKLFMTEIGWLKVEGDTTEVVKD